jgi:hypothetical protein
MPTSSASGRPAGEKKLCILILSECEHEIVNTQIESEAPERGLYPPCLGMAARVCVSRPADNLSACRLSLPRGMRPSVTSWKVSKQCLDRAGCGLAAT